MYSKIEELIRVHNDLTNILNQLGELEDGFESPNYVQLIEDYKWLKVELNHRLNTLKNRGLREIRL